MTPMNDKRKKKEQWLISYWIILWACNRARIVHKLAEFSTTTLSFYSLFVRGKSASGISMPNSYNEIYNLASGSIRRIDCKLHATWEKISWQYLHREFPVLRWYNARHRILIMAVGSNFVINLNEHDICILCCFKV